MSKRLNMSNDEAVEWLLSLKNLDICGENRKTAIDKAIQALEQRWIPVSERLPEVGKKVLCQCQANIYEVLKLTVDGWYHDENHCYMLGFVIAWMPLPEPYKEDAEC